jgi:hypothetical protein
VPVVGTNLAQIDFGVRCVFASLFICVNRCSFSVRIATQDYPKSAARESAEAWVADHPWVTE